MSMAHSKCTQSMTSLTHNAVRAKSTLFNLFALVYRMLHWSEDVHGRGWDGENR